MAGATTLGDLASVIGARTEESAVIAELKAGSEEAYSWLIGEFHQPIYGLIYRIVNDPSDAADTTQDVFLKVFRGDEAFPGRVELEDLDLPHRAARGGKSAPLVAGTRHRKRRSIPSQRVNTNIPEKRGWSIRASCHSKSSPMGKCRP